jgi:hypothetical protein
MTTTDVVLIIRYYYGRSYKYLRWSRSTSSDSRIECAIQLLATSEMEQGITAPVQYIYPRKIRKRMVEVTEKKTSQLSWAFLWSGAWYSGVYAGTAHLR